MLAQFLTLSVERGDDYSHEEVSHEVRAENNVDAEEQTGAVAHLTARLRVRTVRIHRLIHNGGPTNSTGLGNHLLKRNEDVIKPSIIFAPSSTIIITIEVIFNYYI